MKYQLFFQPSKTKFVLMSVVKTEVSEVFIGNVYVEKNLAIFLILLFPCFLYFILFGITILKSWWRFIKTETFNVDFPSQ